VRIQTYTSEWNVETVQRYAEVTDNTFGGAASTSEQPGFSIAIGWNEPHKIFKPYIAVQFWHWHIQAGWLWG
jgi:hypothetical protein